MAHARRLAFLVVAVALAGCGASGGSAGSDADAAAYVSSGGIANGGSSCHIDFTAGRTCS